MHGESAPLPIGRVRLGVVERLAVMEHAASGGEIDHFGLRLVYALDFEQMD